MPDKIRVDDKARPIAQEFFGGTLPPEQIAKFLNFIKEEEKIFEAMPRQEMLEMLQGVAAGIENRLSYDDVEKLAISVQKKFGLAPYDKFSEVKEDPAKHVKTPFEKFIDYCHECEYRADGYGRKQPIDFRTFSLRCRSNKDVDRKFKEFCKENKPSDEEKRIISQILDDFRAKLPAAYGEIFTQRLKREVIFRKLEMANETAKADEKKKVEMAFKKPFTKPKDPFGVSSSALNGFQRLEKPAANGQGAQPQPMKR